jgi:hypothetical protein
MSYTKLCQYHFTAQNDDEEDVSQVAVVDSSDCQMCEEAFDRANDDGRDYSHPYEP